MGGNAFEVAFDAPVVLSDSMGSWHFAVVPADLSDEIKARIDHARPGFGSIRVDVTIGDTSWQTSIFPDSKSGSYLLPVKAPVRKAEQISAGDVVTVELVVLG
jgi:hypothetical protein